MVSTGGNKGAQARRKRQTIVGSVIVIVVSLTSVFWILATQTYKARSCGSMVLHGSLRCGNAVPLGRQFSTSALAQPGKAFSFTFIALHPTGDVTIAKVQVESVTPGLQYLGARINISASVRSGGGLTEGFPYPFLGVRWVGANGLKLQPQASPTSPIGLLSLGFKVPNRIGRFTVKGLILYYSQGKSLYVEPPISDYMTMCTDVHLAVCPPQVIP
jgi:hypothetical protein